MNCEAGEWESAEREERRQSVEAEERMAEKSAQTGGRAESEAPDAGAASWQSMAGREAADAGEEQWGRQQSPKPRVARRRASENAKNARGETMEAGAKERIEER